MYHIVGICPRTDISLGRCGFSIQLFPAWKDMVAKSGLSQDKINVAIHNCHRAWLDGCGYGQMYDPDKTPRQKWEERNMGKTPKLGPNARKLYGEHEIRVAWGEWGAEHITVPGNACGLDIDSGFGCPPGGKVLVPHNVDSTNQVILLLSVFTFFADSIIHAG